MEKWSYIIAMTIAVSCLIFSFFAILAGDITNAPASGVGKLDKAENLNDVFCIMQNTEGEFYTLGYTCIQKFDKFGEFICGSYYDSNSMKQVAGDEFLSLNDGKVVLLDRSQNIICFYNDNLDIVEKCGVEQSYNEKYFYSDYPNTDALKKDIRLSFFDNTVFTDETKIQLDAPRNGLFSRDAGLIIIVAANMFILGLNYLKRKKEDE